MWLHYRTIQCSLAYLSYRNFTWGLKAKSIVLLLLLFSGIYLIFFNSIRQENADSWSPIRYIELTETTDPWLEPKFPSIDSRGNIISSFFLFKQKNYYHHTHLLVIVSNFVGVINEYILLIPLLWLVKVSSSVY